MLLTFSAAHLQTTAQVSNHLRHPHCFIRFLLSPFHSTIDQLDTQYNGFLPLLQLLAGLPTNTYEFGLKLFKYWHLSSPHHLLTYLILVNSIFLFLQLLILSLRAFTPGIAEPAATTYAPGFDAMAIMYDYLFSILLKSPPNI